MTFLNGNGMMAIFYHWQKNNLNTMKCQNFLHFLFSFILVPHDKNIRTICCCYSTCNLSECVCVWVFEKVSWHFHWNGPFKTNPRMKNLRYFFFRPTEKQKPFQHCFVQQLFSYNVVRALASVPFFFSLFTFVHKVIRNFQNIFSSIKLFF